MGGPVPANGGEVEASSLHVGVTELGSAFDQACKNYNDGIMQPYKDFLDRVSGRCLTLQGSLCLTFCTSDDRRREVATGSG